MKAQLTSDELKQFFALAPKRAAPVPFAQHVQTLHLLLDDLSDDGLAALLGEVAQQPTEIMLDAEDSLHRHFVIAKGMAHESLRFDLANFSPPIHIFRFAGTPLPLWQAVVPAYREFLSQAAQAGRLPRRDGAAYEQWCSEVYGLRKKLAAAGHPGFISRDGGILIFLLLLLTSLHALPSNAALYATAQSEYRAQDYSALFGLVQWNRLVAWPTLTPQQRDPWSALELIALARNCRWQEVQALAPATDEGPLTQRARALVQVKEGYRKFTADNVSSSPSPLLELARRQSQWRITAAQLQRLSDPRHVRVKLRSLCE